MTNSEKGKNLEQAVRRIETSIIESSPGYAEATFEIQSNKIFVVKGVRYEVDIWVRATRPDGTAAIFVFECKNRKEKVDKNDIALFDEKLSITGAIRGFFVGRSFTKDAIARFAWNPLLERLVAEELDTSALARSDWGVPSRCNFEDEEVWIGILLKSRQHPKDGFSEELPLEVRGENLPLGKFMADWHVQIRDMFSTLFLPAGLYSFRMEVKTTFNEEEAFLNGEELIDLTVILDAVAVVETAGVISAFDIESRGRTVSYSMSPIALPGGGIAIFSDFSMTIANIPDEPYPQVG